MQTVKILTVQPGKKSFYKVSKQLVYCNPYLLRIGNLENENVVNLTVKISLRVFIFRIPYDPDIKDIFGIIFRVLQGKSFDWSWWCRFHHAAVTADKKDISQQYFQMLLYILVFILNMYFVNKVSCLTFSKVLNN